MKLQTLETLHSWEQHIDELDNSHYKLLLCLFSMFTAKNFYFSKWVHEFKNKQKKILEIGTAPTLSVSEMRNRESRPNFEGEGCVRLAVNARLTLLHYSPQFFAGLILLNFFDSIQLDQFNSFRRQGMRPEGS